MHDHQVALEGLKRNGEYYEAHQDDLLARYPEQWIAVFNEQVVGADADFDQLLDSLDERGIPSENTLIEYATAKDEVFILPG